MVLLQASALAFTVYCLSKSPAKMEKLLQVCPLLLLLTSIVLHTIGQLFLLPYTVSVWVRSPLTYL